MRDDEQFEINSENANEIVEVETNEEITSTLYDLEAQKESFPTREESKKKKDKKPLTKKQKTIIIVVCVVLLVIFIGIIIYFLVFRKDKEEDKPQEEPIVMVEKDNYRFLNGKLVFVDENKKDIGEYTCDNNSEDLCFVAYYENEDEFDITKKVYEDGTAVKTRSDIMNNNYVFIYDNNKKDGGSIVLYDIAANKTISEYSAAKAYTDNSVIVKTTTNEYNVLTFSDSEYTTKFKTNYDFLGFIPESDALVAASNGNYFLINDDGTAVSKAVPGAIRTYNGNALAVKVDNSIYLYGYDGKKIIDTGYSYIRFVDDYAIVLDGKKLYVYSDSGSPMSLETTRITTNNYNTKLIFNNELRQTGKEVAFDAYITNGTMRIEYGDDEALVINLYEGEFSQKLEYITYLQGKLYFYSDAKKTNLIGVYTCKNTNVVNASTTDLTNCYLAKESNIVSSVKEANYLPIYNKTFVFLADNDSSAASSNIVVYNLKTSTTVVTYKEVDAEYHNSSKKVSFVDTAGTLVVAKNTSDSYGVVNIGTSQITGLIKFKNDDLTNTAISVLGNDYLIKRSDDTYHLYDKKGNEITKNVTTKYEIVEYTNDYLLVKNDNKYLVYSLSGTIVSDEYKYIYLENSYYIAFDDENTLQVFKMDKNNLVTDNIKVDNPNDITYTYKNGILTINYEENGELKNIEVALS